MYTCILHDLVVDDPAAQHLQPVVVEEDLQLERRGGEGEVVLDRSVVNGVVVYVRK